MGHRLITALTFLNAMALFATIILIAAATAKDAEIAIPITRAIQTSLRMFVNRILASDGSMGNLGNGNG